MSKCQLWISVIRNYSQSAFLCLIASSSCLNLMKGSTWSSIKGNELFLKVMMTLKLFWFAGVDTTTTNSASGIEAMCPSTKEDFVVFEKLLRDKVTQFEKSVHYSSFLESLFRELCISREWNSSEFVCLFYNCTLKYIRFACYCLSQWK